MIKTRIQKIGSGKRAWPT